MAKKKSKKTNFKSSGYKHASLIRLFAALGGAISIAFHAYDFIMSIINLGSLSGAEAILTALLLPALGIVFDIVLLGSLELINHKWVVKMTWLSLLILAIAIAIINAMYGASQWTFVGTALIVIGAFIAVLDRL